MVEAEIEELRGRVEAHVRALELIPAGGAVTCLVSGGADSTCLWHLLGSLGYAVTALHVNHELRGAESEADARFCVEALGAEVVEAPPRGRGTEEELRDLRYAVSADPARLRATGHTASDAVETVLYRLATSGAPQSIKPQREDGVVRPLLPLWRRETEAYCRAHGLAYRTDTSNADTTRGLIRNEILPLLRRLHPAAEENILAASRAPARLPRGVEETLLALLADRDGSAAASLPNRIRALREYDELTLEQGGVRWGPWVLETDEPGLSVRSWRPGDRLAGRSKKLQDVFTDAKIPRSLRHSWPVVVRGEEVVAVPGLVDSDAVRARRDDAG
jgi:tRNA(Ile)-lysidine synthetase-like protein